MSGSGHKRKFSVKWSDNTISDATARGITNPGAPEVAPKKGKRGPRKQKAPVEAADDDEEQDSSSEDDHAEEEQEESSDDDDNEQNVECCHR